MKKGFVAVILLVFLNSCQQWKLAREEEDKVVFDVEHGTGSRKERKEKAEVKTENKTETKNFASVLDKYSVQLGVNKSELKNGALYEYIDGWMGVPYKYAGNTKEGVDCSGFVNAVFKDVYKIQLKRSATEIVDQCSSIEKSELQESDLVFFDISGKNSHIGIYLANQKFIHASSSKGVMISGLTETYWTKYWGRAGRVKI